MGTNYYLRQNTCKECGRYDQLHIGKSSVGWTFTFQGYRPQLYDEETPKIESYKDWLNLIELDGGEIYDEYNRPISIGDFKYMVEAKRGSANNHAATYDDDPRHEWRDEEGNSFSSREFC